MPDIDTVERFLTEPHVGFVGASRNPKAFANSVYRHLRADGRMMHPVHPAATEIESDRCVTTVADLPDEVRAVLVMLDAERARAVVDQCIDRGIERIWLHQGAGPGAVSPGAVEACHRAGVEVVDGACPMMFAEPVGWLHRAHRVLARRRFTVAGG